MLNIPNYKTKILLLKTIFILTLKCSEFWMEPGQPDQAVSKASLASWVLWSSNEATEMSG